MILLNDGSATHLSTRSTFTHIDLSIVSSDIAPFTSWNIDPQLNGSDHYPIHIKINTRVSYANETKFRRAIFNTDKANWEKYQQHLINIPLRELSNNPNKEIAILQKHIKSGANVAISHRKHYKNKKYSYWWNKELSNLRNKKQDLFYTFKEHPNMNNRIAYMKANSYFKRMSKKSRADSFHNYTGQINPTTPLKKIWNNIKKLHGNNYFKTIHHIMEDIQPIYEQQNIAKKGLYNLMTNILV